VNVHTEAGIEVLVIFFSGWRLGSVAFQQLNAGPQAGITVSQKPKTYYFSYSNKRNKESSVLVLLLILGLKVELRWAEVAFFDGSSFVVGQRRNEQSGREICASRQGVCWVHKCTVILYNGAVSIVICVHNMLQSNTGNAIVFTFPGPYKERCRRLVLLCSVVGVWCNFVEYSIRLPLLYVSECQPVRQYWRGGGCHRLAVSPRVLSAAVENGAYPLLPGRRYPAPSVRRLSASPPEFACRHRGMLSVTHQHM
jgi:hypothetical protein